MKDLKHTPAPWTLKHNAGIGFNLFGNNEAELIAKILPAFEQTPANAKLIASAPELLEALKTLINAVNPRAHGLKNWTEITNYIGSISIPDDKAVFKAIEAYKKATE